MKATPGNNGRPVSDAASRTPSARFLGDRSTLVQHFAWGNDVSALVGRGIVESYEIISKIDHSILLRFGVISCRYSSCNLAVR